MDDGPLVDLFCDETATSPAVSAVGRRSFADAVLCDDGRVLALLLQAEDRQLAATTRHLAYSTGDLQPHMRRVVVSWMLEVSVSQHYHPVCDP